MPTDPVPGLIIALAVAAGLFLIALSAAVLLFADRDRWRHIAADRRRANISFGRSRDRHAITTTPDAHPGRVLAFLRGGDMETR